MTLPIFRFILPDFFSIIHACQLLVCAHSNKVGLCQLSKLPCLLFSLANFCSVRLTLTHLWLTPWFIWRCETALFFLGLWCSFFLFCFLEMEAGWFFCWVCYSISASVPAGVWRPFSLGSAVQLFNTSKWRIVFWNCICDASRILGITF